MVLFTEIVSFVLGVLQSTLPLQTLAYILDEIPA